MDQPAMGGIHAGSEVVRGGGHGGQESTHEGRNRCLKGSPTLESRIWWSSGRSGFDQRLDHKSRMSREAPVRIREGLGVKLPRATRLVILCNGTKKQTEEIREEVHTFLKNKLHLDLSMEKTKITHVNDGFKFLGFWIQRKMGFK